jgi:tetratricopeptide (TPR) repeat protein
MEIDDITATSDYAEETRRVNRRQLMQQAITLAMQSRWQEAADVNRQIVEMAPEDAEAYNRLGKAYTELGRIADAKDAYESALRADPANLIAQRNLDRLSLISEAEAAELTKRAGLKLDPRFFMEETGKTRVTSLQSVSGPEVLATLTAGDQARLEQRDGDIVVTTLDGIEIGVLGSDLSTRLTRLMQTGNEYRAGVVGVDGTELRIMIRETFQSPRNAGRLSFPPRSSAESLPRPYLREGLLRRGSTSEEEDEDELDTDVREGELDEDEEDASEFGFHEGTLDET